MSRSHGAKKKKKKQGPTIDEELRKGRRFEDATRTGVRMRGRGIHPWLHHEGDAVSVGRVTDAGAVELVTSQRQTFAAKDQKARLLFEPRPLPSLAGRWADADVAAWCGHGATPTFADVFVRIKHVLDTMMEVPDRMAAVVAAWILATYFHRLFDAFPRLNFLSEPGSGKTKLLELVAAMGLNGLLQVAPTPAVLFRLIHETRATVALDECEGFDEDDRRQILAVINAGYRASGTVMRVEGDRTRRVEEFSIYSPMALAAIRALHGVTEDRCIPLVLARGTRPELINTTVHPGDPRIVAVRDQATRLLLARAGDVRRALLTVVYPEWLVARPRELWTPLLVMGALADGDGLGLVTDLEAAAKEHVGSRENVSVEGEAVLAVLAEIERQLVGTSAEHASCITVRPRELREPLQKQLGWKEAPTAERVAAWLRRLGFPRTGKDRDGAFYEIDRAHLQKVRERYGGDAGASRV